MTRSSRLLHIIAVSLLLVYGGAMFYVLFLSNLLDKPVQSLPLIFWVFMVSLPLLVLGPPVSSRRGAIVRLAASPRPIWWILVGGVGMLFTAIDQGLQASYLTGWHVFGAAAGCGAVLSAFATWRLRRALSKPGSPLDPPSPWTYMP